MATLSGVHTPDRRWSDRSYLRHRAVEPAQFARVEEYTQAPGGRRVRLTAADGFDVEVLPDRAMDLGNVLFRGVPLGFSTPALTAAGPAGGVEGFARRFGAGLLTTCGLDQYGRPNHDGGQDLPQHGTASELVATGVRTAAEWRDGKYTLEVAGWMRQWRLFGEDLLWERTISVELGGNRLRVRDAIANAGFAPWPHMVLYHMNFGYPLIDAGTTVTVPAGTADPEPRDEWARSGLESWGTIPAPRPNQPERVFRHHLDPAGSGEIIVRNAGLGISAALTVDPRALPEVFQWVSARSGTYALGIEPGTTATMEGRADARARGLLTELHPGETRYYDLDLTVTFDH